MANHLHFSLFYSLCLLIGAAFFVQYGFKRKFPKAEWLSIVVVILTGILLGMKLLGVPAGEWPVLLSSSTGQPAPKFLPGAGLGLISGYIIVRLLFKFRTPMIDSFIMIIPGIIVIQRIGCFFNGCCYGKACELPWAISFSAGSEAVHPTQLYSIAGALLVFFILILTREQWKRPGSRAVFGMSLLLFVRFIVEFFRFTSPDKWYAQTFLSVNLLQWILIVTILFLLIILFIREHSIRPVKDEIKPVESAGLTVMLIASLEVILWNIKRILDYQEILLLQILLVMSFGFLLYRQLFRYGDTRRRVVYLAGSLVMISLMGWQIVDDSTGRPGQDKPNTWFNLRVAGGAGKYEYRSRDCDGNITGRDARFWLGGGMDMNYVIEKEQNKRFTVGIRGHLSGIGDVKREYVDQYDNEWENFYDFGINPYIRFDRKLLGLGIGANFLTLSPWEDIEVVPSVYLRIGDLDRFFVDAGIFDEIYYSSYMSYGHMGIGFRMKSEIESTLRMGLSFAGYDNSDLQDIMNFYIDGDFQIGEQLHLRPGLYLGNQIGGVLGLSMDIGR